MMGTWVRGCTTGVCRLMIERPASKVSWRFKLHMMYKIHLLVITLKGRVRRESVPRIWIEINPPGKASPHAFLLMACAASPELCPFSTPLFSFSFDALFVSCYAHPTLFSIHLFTQKIVQRGELPPFFFSTGVCCNQFGSTSIKTKSQHSSWADKERRPPCATVLLTVTEYLPCFHHLTPLSSYIWCARGLSYQEARDSILRRPSISFDVINLSSLATFSFPPFFSQAFIQFNTINNLIYIKRTMCRPSTLLASLIIALVALSSFASAYSSMRPMRATRTKPPKGSSYSGGHIIRREELNVGPNIVIANYKPLPPSDEVGRFQIFAVAGWAYVFHNNTCVPLSPSLATLIIHLFLLSYLFFIYRHPLMYDVLFYICLHERQSNQERWGSHAGMSQPSSHTSIQVILSRHHQKLTILLPLYHHLWLYLLYRFYELFVYKWSGQQTDACVAHTYFLWALLEQRAKDYHKARAVFKEATER